MPIVTDLQSNVRRFTALALALATAACATAPPAQPPTVPLEQKLGWILRLEDQRSLRDPPPPPPPDSGRRRGRQPVVVPPPVPDLTRLVTDSEGRVRRRAALAIGRVGLREGVAPLSATLADPDPEVREMAAFALGLIGDRGALEALTRTLSDSAPLVQGRAAEALGLIGDASAAPAIAAMAVQHLAAAGLTEIGPDDLTWPGPPSREAYRLALYALARLKTYEPVAQVTLAPDGRPRSDWWPIAYALQRLGDARAVPMLLSLVRSPGRDTAAFAARGLGASKDKSAIPALLDLLKRTAKEGGHPAAIAAVRALAELGAADARQPLIAIVQQAESDPALRLEAVTALGAVGASEATTMLQDLLSDPWPSMRAAALRSLAQVDRGGFLLILSGMDPDPHWHVRAALAGVLATLDAEAAVPRLTDMLTDTDLRTRPAVLEALVKVRAPNAISAVATQLKEADPIVRATAARLVGELKAPQAAEMLADAYRASAGDSTYVARAAIIETLASSGDAGREIIRSGLTDRDWALRLKAAEHVAKFDASADVAGAIRPAPTRVPEGGYEAPRLVNPPVSPHVYIETERGTIQIELAVLEAPLTVDNFVTLARRGYFTNLAIHRVVPNFVVQDGDPRGDGEGGPGYSIRDELNTLPYLRGTVGMALDWRDTGGSQFFITHSPQPHLDARYTVFGRVVSGMDVVDRLRQWDVIKSVRVWEGKP
jgi:cyclophilin family peptidyl-prolyl cis-trans isomerase